MKSKIQPQWVSKTLLGLILNLTLAYALVAFFSWYGPGGIQAPAKVQVSMWLLTPLWLTGFSLTYLFSSWRTALLLLGGTNLMLWSVFAGLRMAG